MGCAASTGPLYRDEHDFATTAAYYDKDDDVKKDWAENEQLGEGMFARVVKVTRKATNQQYACKVLREAQRPGARGRRDVDGFARGARDGRHVRAAHFDKRVRWKFCRGF